MNDLMARPPLTIILWLAWLVGMVVFVNIHFKAWQSNRHNNQGGQPMNELYTNTPCGGGDMPGWMVAALCAIPVLLVILDFLGGCQ